MNSIKTYYDPPPIPSRRFDWSAISDNYEAGDPVGYGSTEQSAIADLCQQIEDLGDEWESDEDDTDE